MSSKKSRKQLESDSDSGPEDRNPPKKAKGQKASGSSSSNDNEDNRFKLSNKRFVTVREFRGKVMVDIREFYDADGELKPGKKGICLSAEQWHTLKEHIDDIDAAVKKF